MVALLRTLIGTVPVGYEVLEYIGALVGVLLIMRGFLGILELVLGGLKGR